MNDSLGGIHIAQDAAQIEIGSFRVSLPEREIFCRSLFLGDADGFVNLTPRLIPPKEDKGAPWNLGFLKLALDDVDFRFSKPADSLKLETYIGKGSINANKLDLRTRTADFKRISLEKSRIAVQAGNAAKNEQTPLDGKEEPLLWKLQSESIEIKNSTASLGSEPWEIYSEIDLDISDLRLDEDQAGMKVKKMAFEMANGFSLKRMRGELDSNRDQTRFQTEIKTGNSLLVFAGSAEEGFQDILSGYGEIAAGLLDMEKSRISLRDISYFMEDLEESPFYAQLLTLQLNMEATLNINGPLYSLSECSVSQEKNFNITLAGDIANPFQLSEATGDLHLEIFGLDQAWLEKLASGFGFTQTLPDLSDLKVHGSLSDTLEAPDIYVAVQSQSGSMDLAGSLDFRDELFKLAFSCQRLALGGLLAVPDLGYFTGAGEIKGKGFSGENLNAGFYLQLDTLGFKMYDYTQTQLTGTLEPGAYEVQMVANDSSLKGDINVGLSLADSTFGLQVSGILQAQLNELNFTEDTLAFETSIEARLTSSGRELESELTVGGFTLTTPWETAVVRELNASFKTDSILSTLHADADFFSVDLTMKERINELDSLGRGYQDYFASFREASHITAANRVSTLPDINAVAQVSHHEILDILVEDTSFYFSNLDISIVKQADQNSLHTLVRGDALSYKMVDTGKLNAEVSDSAGVIMLELLADNASLLAGPENRWMLSSSFSNQNVLTSLSVDDYQDGNLYQIDVAGWADSVQLVLEIPGRVLTLNGQQWQLEKPDLLSIDLSTNKILPSLQMKTDSSYLHLNTQSQDPFFTYTLDLGQVELESLIRTDIFPGSPELTVSGSFEYRTDRDAERKIATGLQLGEIRFYDQDLSDIQLDGTLSRGLSGAYIIDLLARMDSVNVVLKGEKTESGERSMDGSLSHFPLAILEPFTQEYLTELGGSISGRFDISSQRESEQINGELIFSDASVKVNLLNSTFRIPDEHISLTDEKIMFNKFAVLDTLERPLELNGFVDFGDKRGISADLNITSSALQVMSHDESSRVPLSGNVFVDSRISIKGPLTHPDLEGIIHLSEGTEIFYHHMEDLRMTETQKLVNFVDHTIDEEPKATVLTGPATLMSSSIETIIEIDPSTRINFSLAKRMFNIDLDVKGGGNLQYNLENEQMTLSGRYEIGEGSALVKLVGWPDKSFSLAEDGYISWDGMAENPQMSLEAENKVSTSYVNPIDGKNRNVDFFVILKLSGYLSDLDVLFTISTPDQYVMSIINTMSPEEQMRQAMSVLLFEIIDLPGISSSSDYMTQQVNQILSSQLNQLTESTIQGVDISFGLNTYDQNISDGSNETTTSLSYEVSKSLLNDRAQIEVSGRINDGNQTASTSDHSLNNVSFEYQLDSAASKYLKIYNEHTYDDVFDGEVIQTGVGFSYRKRYKTFRDIWRRKK